MSLDKETFARVTGRYAGLRLAVVGDFCLDRYLEIDPDREEVSIETGLPVHNVVSVRSQPGGAGTILNNLVALGIGAIFPVGVAGMDGEGFELQRALRSQNPSIVRTEYFLRTSGRRTFTYTKPLLVKHGKPPQELNRLDLKNWTPTPGQLERKLIRALGSVAQKVDGIMLLDQVDLPQTGVVTRGLLESVDQLARSKPELLILADSRRGLRGYPPVCLKMNLSEFLSLVNLPVRPPLKELRQHAKRLAQAHGRPVFITLAEDGMLGADPAGSIEYVPALPVHGPIDIVGAGDAVSANLLAAMAAGASLGEAMQLANCAASIVIHKLGTTGTASVRQLREGLFQGANKPLD